MIIGSHVSYGPRGILSSCEEAILYGANTFMFYTGAPQNTIRKDIDMEDVIGAQKLMKENDIDIKNVVCHAPYIVNLANNLDLDKYTFAINFLKKEIDRCKQMGVKLIVLHPGSSTTINRSVAIKNIIYALNIILDSTEDVCICLESMAGKGTEIGINIMELKTIIDGVNNKEMIGVCLDTCHLNDSGIQIKDFDEYLNEFDKEIGIEKIKVVHLNDSKNELGSKKDRHENIGYGTIGFDNLVNVAYNERLKNVPKILETPHLKVKPDGKKDFAPYKYEIQMIKDKKFDDFKSKLGI